MPIADPVQINSWIPNRLCAHIHQFSDCSHTNRIQQTQMNDFMVDKRVFAQHPKRKNQGRAVLPEIKYTINFNINGTNILKKFNEDPMTKELPQKAKQPQAYQPFLASILTSKRIPTATNPEDSPYAIRKKQNFIIRKESLIRILNNDHDDNIEDSERIATSFEQRMQVKEQRLQVKEQTKSTQEQCSKIKITRNDEFSVFIGRGNNNEELVREILLSRNVWKEVKAGEGTPHLKWVFSKQRHNYKTMWSYTKTRSINHFEYNEEVATKDNLIRNLQIYCETKKLQIFTVTPVTFIIDFDDEYCEYNLKQFLSFFLKNDPRKMGSSTRRNGLATYNFINKFRSSMAWQNSDVKKKVNILSRPVNSCTYYSGEENPSYIWLLKPTGLNRGRGIEIFDSLEALEKILMEYLQMMNRRKAENAVSPARHKQRNSKDVQLDDEKGMEESQESKETKFCTQKFKLSACSFVIQKYIERPFLIERRKFDVRVWALVDHHLNIYFCREGYIRTSTEVFSTHNIDNYFIHLTNNAIQKNSASYGQFESGNQISYKSLAQFISQQQCDSIWQRMKEITHMVFSSVKKKLNQNQRKFCFQLFGLDFIIDQELKVWLIEVNDSPCLECSSSLLSALMPRMVNDVFKLTIDQIFTEKRAFEKMYPVPGYSNSESIWENLGQLAPNAEYSPKKSPLLPKS